MNKALFDSTARVHAALKGSGPEKGREEWLRVVCDYPKLGMPWIKGHTPKSLLAALLNADWEPCILPERTSAEYFKTRLPISPGVVDLRMLPPDATVTLQCSTGVDNRPVRRPGRRKSKGRTLVVSAVCSRVIVPDEEFTVIGLYDISRREDVDGVPRTLTSSATQLKVASEKHHGRVCSAEEAWNMGLIRARVSGL